MVDHKEHEVIKNESESSKDAVRPANKSDKIILTWKIISCILFVLLLVSIFTGGFGSCPASIQQGQSKENATIVATGNTFQMNTNEAVCKENGKPIIRLFSTTACPHCRWIKDTYDKVAKEYVDQGKIVAYHWEFDTGDNTLTDQRESEIPSTEKDVYYKFNPSGTVPTFVFGCKYFRVGNAFESEGDLGLAKEEAEFRKVIDGLIASN